MINIILKTWLLLFVAIFSCSCRASSADVFLPSHPSPNKFRPLQVCGQFDFLPAHVLSYEEPDTDCVPLFADRPFFWTAATHALFIDYKGIRYTLPAKDHNGWPPKLTSNELVYVGEDEQSVVSYDFSSHTSRRYLVDSRIIRIYGDSTLFSIGDKSRDGNRNVYLIDPDSSVRIIGTIHDTSNSYPITYEKDNKMYIALGTSIYECTNEEITKVFDFDPIVSLDPSQFDSLHIEGLSANDSKRLLIRHGREYFDLSLDSQPAQILDSFQFAHYNSLPVFAYFNGQLVTCVDNAIYGRNATDKSFQALAELPPDIGTFSSEEPYSVFPANMIIHIFDACYGKLALVTERGVAIFDSERGKFEQYILINDSDERINSVSSNSNYLILGTDSGRYFMVNRLQT